MNLYQPHKYQQEAIDFVLKNNSCGLILDMGLGKTSIVLTAFEQLISNLEVRKPLIIAPKRICEHTWDAEIKKWTHLSHLKISRIIGNEKQRLVALNTNADLYIISRDNIAWLIDYSQRILKKFLFDCLIIDESSSFKNRQSIRFKSVRKVLNKVNRVVILTGTPTPAGLLDLWPQIYLLDQGQRLCKTFTNYRDLYFTAGAQSGHIVFQYNLKP
jgi:SNF2 family DNA or RNA helicase